MPVSTVPMLIDVGVARIKQIVIVRLSPLETVTLKEHDEIVEFIENNPVEVQWLDGLWCSVKPENGWLNFHVELKR